MEESMYGPRLGVFSDRMITVYVSIDMQKIDFCKIYKYLWYYTYIFISSIIQK